jgi:peptidoglycan/LPS O-acetylase OafA/YrhL
VNQLRKPIENERVLILPNQGLSLLAQIGQGDRMDWVRLIAATGVIFGHSFALAMKGKSGVTEPFTVWTPGIYSGAIAVLAFFVLSGFLITHSLLGNSDLLRFFKARFWRIFPAYFVMLVGSVLVIGPMISHLPLGEYLSHPQTWRYFLSALNFDLFWPTIWSVPGFQGFQNDALNGSLWSLSAEVKLYLLSGLAVLLGAYRFPKWGTFLALSGLVAVLFKGALQTGASEVWNAIFMYALGALIRFQAHAIRINFLIPLLLIILVYFMRFAAPVYLYALTIAAGVFYLAYAFPNMRWKLPGDYSFGLFLWGFPIQQLIANVLPNLGPYRFFVLSFAITLVIAIASWHFIEKPALSRAKRDRAKV